MNTSIIIIFLIISLVGMFVFWLMYRNANNTNSQAQQFLLHKLQDTNLSKEERQNYENQLSSLLQNNKVQGNLKITAILTFLITVSSFVLYQYLGTPNAAEKILLATQNQTQNQNQNQNTNPTQNQAPQMSMQEAIAQLEQRLAQNPDDVDGQMLYARSLVSLKNYDKAVIAYRKSNKLAPNESVIITELAEAIALANDNRSFLGEPEALLAQAVELEPTNQKALWLLGMTFYEKKDLAKTNELWTNLYQMLSDEGAKKQLQEQLNDIRSQLGVGSIVTESTSDKLANLEIKDKSALTIKINLAETLIDNLKGKRALLYIYTKESTGMPMPIAVVRKPLEQIVKGFPIEVNMNDGNSLQPTRKLSNFNQIKIGARISFTGNAMPTAGDLQSEELLIDLPYSNKVELVIDKVR